MNSQPSPTGLITWNCSGMDGESRPQIRVRSLVYGFDCSGEFEELQEAIDYLRDIQERITQ